MKLDGWAWAAFFARWVLGLIFFMAGWWKVFDLTAVEHARMLFVDAYADTWIPVWLLWALGVAIPFVELLGGAMVCLGVRVRSALVALGFVLVIVTYGHLLSEALFKITGHIFPRLVLLLFVFMIPRERDLLSVDHWLSRRRAK